MLVTNDFWGRHANATGIGSNKQKPKVVFTTEAETVMQEQQAWVKSDMHANSPFQFEFVTNSRDLMPGTGFMKDCTYCKLPCSSRSILFSDRFVSHTFVLVVDYYSSSREETGRKIRPRLEHALLPVFAQGAVVAPSLDWQLLFQLSRHAQRFSTGRVWGGKREYIHVFAGVPRSCPQGMLWMAP